MASATISIAKGVRRDNTGFCRDGVAGAYYRLSRRGMEEAAVYGLSGFFYVSADEVMATEDLSTQRRWCLFFAPANWVDQCVFGGPPPIQDIMFRLS